MRRMFVVAVAVVAAVALGACSRTAAPAARVNGAAVSQDQLWNHVAAQKRLSEVTGDTSSTLAAGTLESSYTASGVSEVLGGLVVNTIAEQELERLGVVVDDAAVAKVRAQVQQSKQDADVLDQLTPADQELLLRQFAVNQSLQDYASDPSHPTELDDATVSTFFDQDPEQFRTVCLRILFTTAEPQAEQARARIAAGEAFEGVTAEMSVDPEQSKGGAVQCLSERSLPAELADAIAASRPSTLLAPVKTADGYFVVFYAETREPSLDTARALIADQVAANPRVKLQLIIQRAVRDAQVEVNPEFGMWTGDLQSPVVPRTGPGSTGEEGQGISAEDRSRRDDLMARLPAGFLAQLPPEQRARIDAMPLDQLEVLVQQVERTQLGSTSPPVVDEGGSGGTGSDGLGPVDTPAG